MKTFYSILALLILVSCTSSTGPEEIEYPHSAGNWIVESPTYAWYAGLQSGGSDAAKQAMDTVVVAQAGDYGLDVETDHDVEHGFTLNFDNTGVPRDSVNGAQSEVAFSDTVFGDRHLGLRPSSKDGYLTLTFDFQYSCPEPFDDSKIWITTYRTDTDIPYRVFEFQSAGFEQVIQEITQCITP